LFFGIAKKKNENEKKCFFLRFKPLLFKLEHLPLGEMQVADRGLRLLGCMK
jgi:hypothetical protein